MKKFYMFLMLLMLSLSLVACGSSESTSKKEDKKTQEGEKKSKKKKKKKKDKKSKDENEADEDETEEETKEKKKKSASKGVGGATLQSYTAVDSEDYSITVNSIEEDDILGFTVNITIENKSSDQDYSFEADNCSINGVQTGVSMYSDVAAGKKANTKITFDDLKAYGIEKYTDIEVHIAVSDASLGGDELGEENIHIYPYGEENAVKFVYEQKSTDKVLIDNEYLTLIYTGVDKEDLWGYALNFYVVNKTDVEMVLNADNVSVDGYMADPFFIEYVYAGKSDFISMSWFDSTLEQNNIDKNNISNIEFTMDVYDGDDYNKAHFATETITINP